MSKITEQIEQIAQPITSELGLELVDVEFLKEGRDWFLRVFVDNPEAPIDIEQCALVSEKLSGILDELDPIEQNYFLEVSSPGAERPLKKEKDFEKAIGKFIYIKTYEPVEDAKEFEGYLKSFDDEQVEIEIKIKTRRKIISIAKNKIAVIRLAIDFSVKPD
ncbi:putative transcription termination protein NusA [Planococcus halocryophilus Or1]|uniref:Ribosome maturation factor RimP n=1 Tax=Planococcus halocryophilus TaxID=1215089 RepID=A0A1C7DQ68_9BACL|nr:ribosome maturation factor RimP [Planococcus halocryophilus]ANU13542.1 ribosome maturation factor RimP [Planococcus halocryophilus]EMF46350.1 putative transcription termination protein NusA [Planococcus halocryophilus Or1]